MTDEQPDRPTLTANEPVAMKDAAGLPDYCSGCTHWVHLHGSEGCQVGCTGLTTDNGGLRCECPATYHELREKRDDSTRAGDPDVRVPGGSVDSVLSQPDRATLTACPECGAPPVCCSSVHTFDPPTSEDNYTFTCECAVTVDREGIRIVTSPCRKTLTDLKHAINALVRASTVSAEVKADIIAGLHYSFPDWPDL